MTFFPPQDRSHGPSLSVPTLSPLVGDQVVNKKAKVEDSVKLHFSVIRGKDKVTFLFPFQGKTVEDLWDAATQLAIKKQKISDTEEFCKWVVVSDGQKTWEESIKLDEDSFLEYCALPNARVAAEVKQK